MGTTTTKSNMDKYIIITRTIYHEKGMEDMDSTDSYVVDGLAELQREIPYVIPTPQPFYRTGDGKKFEGKLKKVIIRNEKGDIIGWDVTRDIHCCGKEEPCGTERREIRIAKVLYTDDIGNILKKDYSLPD